MPTVYPSALGFLGIAKEVTPGTAVAPARFIPYAPGEWKPKAMVELLVDEGVRGSMAREYGAVTGKHNAEAELAGNLFADSFGDLLLNMLGAVATTGSDPYEHTFSLLNSGQGQPPTHTLTDRQGITASTGARAYPYSCLEKLTLKGNATGLVEYEATWKGFPSAAAGLAPTNAPPASTVTPAWRSAVSLGGTAAPAVKEWEVTLNRVLEVDHTADGTQSPWVIGRGELTVEGKVTVRASNSTPLAAEVPLTTYIAGTQQALTIDISDNLGGTSGHSLLLTMTQAIFSEVNDTRETLIGWEIGYKGLANSTDAGASGGASPIKATLVNGVTAY